jgi:hypothetical protein
MARTSTERPPTNQIPKRMAVKSNGGLIGQMGAVVTEDGIVITTERSEVSVQDS